MEPYRGRSFRGEVLAACDTNEERRGVALAFQCALRIMGARIQQQRRETGQVAAKRRLHGKPKLALPAADWLVAKEWLAGPTILSARNCKRN